MLSFDLGLRLRAGSHDFHLNAAHRVAEDGLLGIRGASGSGKTTLLRCLAGLSRPIPARSGWARRHGTARSKESSSRRGGGRSASCFKTTPYSRI